MTYIALLRGINVGGNNKVAMTELKLVFESLGFTNVATYINSGNVIFDSKKEISISAIEKALEKRFGFAVRIVVRDEKNIRRLIKSIPEEWQNGMGQKTDILFLWKDFDNKKSLDLLLIREGIDNILYISGALVWNIQIKDYGKSGMSKLVGTPLYKHSTARNVNTVRKLGQLLEKRKM